MKISKRKMALLVASAGLSFSALTGCSSQQQKEDDEDREGGVVVPASNSYIKHSSKSSTENGWHQYMGIDVLLFSQEQWDRIRLATERIGRIYQKMYEFLMSEEGALWFGRLSLPVHTWDATNVPSSSKIADILGFSPGKVDYRIRILQSKGLLKKKRA